MRGVSEAELKEMLESIAWRRVKEEWRDELEKKSKLVMLKENCGIRRGSDIKLCWMEGEE